MCGRYTFHPKENEEIQKIYDLAKENSETIKTGEIFPSDTKALILINQGNNIQVAGMEWCFPEFKSSQLIINARSEIVTEKKMFAKSFQKNRCVFPTTGFFSGLKKKKKTFLRSKESQSIFVASTRNLRMDSVTLF